MECIVKENDILVNIYTNESERVLWIDENNLFCYCIQIMTQKFKVNKVTIEEINSKFDNGIYTIMPKDNTYKIADINKLTEYRREQLELRSKIIKEIDNMSTVPSCFTKKNRGILIENVLERYEVSKKTVYNWLRKYWQGGRTLDSLIDEYDNCGKSTVKKYKKKPGRKISACLGNDDFNGIIITDDVKKIFKQGIKRYKNNESLSLKKTFDYIISDNYYDKLWYEKPTYNQFYYWYQNEVNIDEMVKSRKGEKNYQNNLRALKSDSIYDSPFPGFRYQVDSTIFPIYLVNRIDRNLSVGRPRVYFAVDVYSRIITGIHIGFEEDSWEGYSKLLYNTFFDKQIYCNYFDIKISKEDWNVCGLPKIILGDRGGFINKKSDVLYNYFNISVELAPSYIASSKGAVEKKFDIIEKMIKDELPGVIMTKFRERGKRDYRKDAKLDIYEFTQIIIETVLERNAKIMMNYPSQKELALANVKPCANDIWNYAMKNTGNLTNIQEDKLRYHLLQHEKAKKTHKGIEYRKFIYKIEDAKIETAISRLHKSKGVEIIYDESNLNVIYMCDNDSKKLIKCILNDKFTSNDIYYDRTMQEIINYDINMTIKNQSTFRDINDQLFHDQEQNRKEIINNAINKSQGNKIDVNEIEFNRNTEKESYNEYQRNMIDELNSNNIDGNSDDFEVRNHSESTTKLKRSRDILSDFIQNKISDK